MLFLIITSTARDSKIIHRTNNLKIGLHSLSLRRRTISSALAKFSFANNTQLTWRHDRNRHIYIILLKMSWTVLGVVGSLRCMLEYLSTFSKFFFSNEEFWVDSSSWIAGVGVVGSCGFAKLSVSGIVSDSKNGVQFSFLNSTQNFKFHEGLSN